MRYARIIRLTMPGVVAAGLVLGSVGSAQAQRMNDDDYVPRNAQEAYEAGQDWALVINAVTLEIIGVTPPSAPRPVPPAPSAEFPYREAVTRYPDGSSITYFVISAPSSGSGTPTVLVGDPITVTQDTE